MSRNLGLKLISVGAKLAFESKADRDLLKELINSDTIIGSYADSGGHIHGNFQPMNDYDTQSVINVLKHIARLCEEIKKDSMPSTKKISHYQEEWIN